MDGFSCTRRSFIKSATAFSGAAGLGWLPAETWGRNRPIPTRPLGRTGVDIPILGLGTAPLGYGLSPDESERLVDIALDLGVTYLDTAYNYAHAQKDIGRVMKRRRNEAFLATKTHTTAGRVARLQLEESLRVLQTDRVDVVHVHSIGSLDIEKVLGPGGTLEALLKAKEQGLTRFVGITAHNLPPSVMRVLSTGCIDVAMVPVNFVDRHIYDFEQTLLPLAERADIGIVAMKVFGGAKHVPFGRGKTPPLQQEMMDLAFRYSLSLSPVACAVIGVYSEEELSENVARAQRFAPLSPSEKRILHGEGRRLASKLPPPFGQVA